MNISQLNKILATEPTYRQKQARAAIFKDLISNWDEASTLPKALRDSLNVACPLEIENNLVPAKDKKIFKALITLDDGLKIETVLMDHSERRTVCVSSQVGCPLGCTFCATGQLGFKRNLKADEIIDQVLFWARYLKSKDQKINNIVFMGMGEPFLNYDNVLNAIKMINETDGLNIGARHISISTAGIVPGIKKLAKEKLQVNLALSLHSANQKLRKLLMPVAGQESLNKVLGAIDNYIELTGRKVMYEYILLKGINDTPLAASELVDLLGGRRLSFVNLILYNDTGRFSASDKERIRIFKEILRKNKIEFSERYRFGNEIDAACGQLAGKG